MARKTTTFTTDAIGAMEAITAPIACREVTIYNHGQAGSSAYNIAAPLSTDTQVRRPANAKTVFRAYKSFTANQIVGYISLVSGSETFDLEAD